MVSRDLAPLPPQPVRDAMGQITFEMGLQQCMRARFVRVRTPGRFRHRRQKASTVASARTGFLDCDVGKVLCLQLSVGQTRNVTQHPVAFIRWHMVLAPMTGH